MFTFNGRDSHRSLAPSRIHLPFQRPIGEILPERVKTEDDEVGFFDFSRFVRVLAHYRPIQPFNGFRLPVYVAHGLEHMHC